MNKTPIEIQLLDEWEKEKARFRESVAPIEDEQVYIANPKPVDEPPLEFWIILTVVGLLGFLTVFGLGS